MSLRVERGRLVVAEGDAEARSEGRSALLLIRDNGVRVFLPVVCCGEGEDESREGRFMELLVRVNGGRERLPDGGAVGARRVDVKWVTLLDDGGSPGSGDPERAGMLSIAERRG